MRSAFPQLSSRSVEGKGHQTKELGRVLARQVGDGSYRDSSHSKTSGTAAEKRLSPKMEWNSGWSPFYVIEARTPIATLAVSTLVVASEKALKLMTFPDNVNADKGTSMDCTSETFLRFWYVKTMRMRRFTGVTRVTYRCVYPVILQYIRVQYEFQITKWSFLTK